MKIKYIMQHEETGTITEREFGIDDAVNGIVFDWLTNDMRRYFVANRHIVSEFVNKMIDAKDFFKLTQKEQISYVHALEAENLKLIDENKQKQCCGNCENWNPFADACRISCGDASLNCKSVCGMWKQSEDRQ